VTATRIRDLLEAGDPSAAARLLSRPYYLRAQVVPGRMEGRQLGFPTANIVIHDAYVHLAEGVYAGYAWVGDMRYKAAISVGIPPTFTGAAPTTEVHILGFAEDIYGEDIKVAFVEYLRPMQKFASIQDLQDTVNTNIAWVAANL
jgi:riboflavin kinase/FMN adenylyltransferase